MEGEWRGMEKYGDGCEELVQDYSLYMPLRLVVELGLPSMTTTKTDHISNKSQ